MTQSITMNQISSDTLIFHDIWPKNEAAADVSEKSVLQEKVNNYVHTSWHDILVFLQKTKSVETLQDKSIIDRVANDFKLQSLKARNCFEFFYKSFFLKNASFRQHMLFFCMKNKLMLLGIQIILNEFETLLNEELYKPILEKIKKTSNLKEIIQLLSQLKEDQSIKRCITKLQFFADDESSIILHSFLKDFLTDSDFIRHYEEIADFLKDPFLLNFFNKVMMLIQKKEPLNYELDLPKLLNLSIVNQPLDIADEELSKLKLNKNSLFTSIHLAMEEFFYLYTKVLKDLKLQASSMSADNEFVSMLTGSLPSIPLPDIFSILGIKMSSKPDSFSIRTILLEFFNASTIHSIALQYGLKVADWNPKKDDIDSLINTLKKDGPLYVRGQFGSHFYSEKPFKMDKKLADKEIYAWKPGATRKSHSKILCDSKVVYYHAVLLIGAEKTVKSALVYFADLQERRTYAISYQNLQKHVTCLNYRPLGFCFPNDLEYAYHA